MGSEDTTRRFLHSSGAAIFSQAWRVAVTFGTMLVLKRLIPAGDWGLWNWALPLFMILGALRDLGLVYHVVRVKPRPYGNLLLLQIVWGGVLFALVNLGAPLFARAYAAPHPDILSVLRLLTLFLFLEGVATVPRVYFEGELRIGRAVAPELMRNVVLAGSSIGLAFAGFGVWSLVIGQVLSAGIYAAMLWWRAWGEIPLLWQRGKTLSLVRESMPLAAIWFLIILVRHVDPLILGARFEGAVVGNYVFAYENAFRISEIVVPAIGRALYPALVAFASEGRRLLDAYGLATVLILALEIPVAFFLFVNAELTLQILGGSQWHGAPTYLRILCFAPLVDPFSRLGGEVLKVKRMDSLWIISTCITLVTFVVGGIVLTGLWGPVGMAWINLLPLGGLLMAWGLWKVGPEAFRQLVGRLAFLFLVPLPLFLAVYFLAGDHLELQFLLSLVCVAISLGVFYWRFGSEFRAFFRSGKSAKS